MKFPNSFNVGIWYLQDMFEIIKCIEKEARTYPRGGGGRGAGPPPPPSPRGGWGALAGRRPAGAAQPPLPRGPQARRAKARGSTLPLMPKNAF